MRYMLKLLWEIIPSMSTVEKQPFSALRSEVIGGEKRGDGSAGREMLEDYRVKTH